MEAMCGILLKNDISTQHANCQYTTEEKLSGKIQPVLQTH